jgi:transposase-like protein
MTEYSATFKANMVKKLLIGGTTATSLSARTGVAQPTLSRWLRDAREKGMSPSKHTPRTARRPSEWKPEEKLRVLAEADGLSNDELGELLRREGLHEADLAEWRRATLAALGSVEKTPSGSQARRVRELEKELRRKDRALAETAALLVLQKKAQELWGDEDDDTKKETDK